MLLAKRKGEVLEGRLNLPRSRSPYLGKWSQEFLKSIEHSETRSRYCSSVNNMLRYFGSEIRLCDLTPERIFVFRQKRLDEGAGRATVNRDVATLSSMLSLAKRLRLISQNPCRDIERLNERRERRQAKPISYEEEARLKSLSPPWLSVLITVLAETGLRVHKEALPLLWTDVELDSQVPCIRVRDSKTPAGVRTVWLTQHCRNTLLEWRQLWGLTFSPFVFPSPRIPGNHITDCKKAWQKAAREAGLQNRRIYDLRATFATRANACSASGLTLAQLLGHSSTRILPTYVKPLDENTRAIIEAMDQTRASHSGDTRCISTVLREDKAHGSH